MNDDRAGRRLPIIHRITDEENGPFQRQHLDLEFSNGERRRFERLVSRGHGAVVVVPMLDDETVLLVREYAAGMHRYELGLVKGRIDAGETPEQAADRELKEEEVIPWKLAELDQLMLREDFSEGRSLAALFIARQWLQGLR